MIWENEISVKENYAFKLHQKIFTQMINGNKIGKFVSISSKLKTLVTQRCV